MSWIGCSEGSRWRRREEEEEYEEEVKKKKKDDGEVSRVR